MGKVITSEEIKKALSKLWPGLDFRLFTDGLWIAPTLADLEHFVFDEYQPIATKENVFECEEMMDHIVNFRRENIEYNNGQKYNWALGKIGGLSFEDYPGKHYRNICYTSDHGLMIVEPQPIEKENRIRKPNPKLDKIVWFRM